MGSGLMGASAAKYLVQRKEIQTVRLADIDKSRLDQVGRSLKSKKLVLQPVEPGERSSLVEAIEGNDAVLLALPHLAAYGADLAAIKAGVNAVDLVFTDEQMKLHSKFSKAGLTLIPGCGVAPGIAQILAGEGARQMDSVDCIRILVGGLPQDPRPPLNYKIVFSLESVLQMYSNTNVRIIRDGKLKMTRAMTEIEKVSFPKPFENMECFLTDGAATLIHTMKGKVRNLEEKTIRYPGHAEQIKTLIGTGITSTKPVRVSKGKVVPRTMLSAVLGPKLQLGKGKDVTLLRVTVTGRKGDANVKREYETVDYYDEREKVTSMARTTAFTGAIAAMMLAEGKIKETGLLTPETCFAGPRFTTLFQRLAEKNIVISSTVTSTRRDISRPSKP
jgi:lysine 6-dehydrogenase